MKKMLISLSLAVVLSLAIGSTVLAACGANVGRMDPGEQCDAGQANAVCDAAGTVKCDVNCMLCSTVPDLGTNYAGQIGLGGQDIRTTVASIIRTAMGLLGIVAVVIILIGGFTWMTAGGNDDKVGEAKKWIIAGVIGLGIILSAFALSSFVINSLISATTTPDVVPLNQVQ